MRIECNLSALRLKKHIMRSNCERPVENGVGVGVATEILVIQRELLENKDVPGIQL